MPSSASVASSAAQLALALRMACKKYKTETVDVKAPTPLDHRAVMPVSRMQMATKKATQTQKQAAAIAQTTVSEDMAF